jgi:uncharacterized protein (DUF2147 family)
MHLHNIKACCSFFAIMLIYSSTSAQTEGDTLIGRWYTEGCQAAFDFYRDNQEYKARMVPLAKPDLVDSKNPVDSLKTRKLNGMTSIYGLTYDSKGKRWANGKVYNPENGKTYSCHCSLDASGTKLLFRGYIGVSLLGGNQTWTRERCNKNQ